MGLFDKLKPNKNNKDFFEWLDLILKNELNSEIKAINFNLYEDTETYQAALGRTSARRAARRKGDAVRFPLLCHGEPEAALRSRIVRRCLKTPWPNPSMERSVTNE